ncbi:MAG TPA: hypothetical protein VFB13_06805 [Reyranella sp.]|nr:hypothetical protein [Reyranella sp.]
MTVRAVGAYLIAHWRGALSLRRSFLLNGLLAYVVLVFGLLALQQVFTTIYLFYASFVIIIAWQIWATVGILRSALRVWRAPDPAYPHPSALRFFIVLAVLITIAAAIGTLSDLDVLLD